MLTSFSLRVVVRGDGGESLSRVEREKLVFMKCPDEVLKLWYESQDEEEFMVRCLTLPEEALVSPWYLVYQEDGARDAYRVIGWYPNERTIGVCVVRVKPAFTGVNKWVIPPSYRGSKLNGLLDFGRVTVDVSVAADWVVWFDEYHRYFEVHPDGLMCKLCHAKVSFKDAPSHIHQHKLLKR